MAPTYRGRRKNAVLEGPSQGHEIADGVGGGSSNQAAENYEGPIRQAAPPVLRSPGGRLKPILSTYSGVLSVRREFGVRLHDDVEAFLRHLLHRGMSEDSSDADRLLAFQVAKLILDKTLGQPKDAYDEHQVGMIEVRERTILAEAERVQKHSNSAPLKRYIEIAEKGIVRRDEDS